MKTYPAIGADFQVLDDRSDGFLGAGGACAFTAQGGTRTTSLS